MRHLVVGVTSSDVAYAFLRCEDVLKVRISEDIDEATLQGSEESLP